MTQWQLTKHARERLQDRGISAEQLDEVLRHPSQNLPSAKRDGLRVYVGGGVMAVVDEAARKVITVGIDGAVGNDWVRFAPPAAAPLVEPPTPLVMPRARRSPSSARRGPAVADVVSRNVLDGVHPQIAATVRRLVRQRGLDLRAVRVCSPTDVRIVV